MVRTLAKVVLEKPHEPTRCRIRGVSFRTRLFSLYRRVGRCAAACSAPPNIVFVLVDDLRWDELGCMGHPYVQTPHVDRLAKEGALFRNAFTVAPLCSPSRAAFLDGPLSACQRHRRQYQPQPASHQLVTFPRLLHEAGYKTAFFGKWHMGNDDSPRPGFDEWLVPQGTGRSDRSAAQQQRREQGRSRLCHRRPHRTAPSSSSANAATSRSACTWPRRRCTRIFDSATTASIATIGGGGFVAAERHRQLYKDAKIPHRPNYSAAAGGQAGVGPVD